MEQTVTKTDNQKKKIIPAVKPKTDTSKKLVTEVKASARYIRMSPRKVRLVVDQIRHAEVVTALHLLRFANRAAVLPVAKLLNSAVANADHNFHIDAKDLFIKYIAVNEGPTSRRFRPRAHGSSAPIRKRTSHIMLILGVRPGAAKKTTGAKSNADLKSDEVKVISPDEIKKSGPKSGGKPGQDSSEKGGKGQKGFLRGVFQRKTG